MKSFKGEKYCHYCGYMIWSWKCNVWKLSHLQCHGPHKQFPFYVKTTEKMKLVSIENYNSFCGKDKGILWFTQCYEVWMLLVLECYWGLSLVYVSLISTLYTWLCFARLLWLILITTYLLIGQAQVEFSLSVNPLGIERDLIWYLKRSRVILYGLREGNIVFNRIKLVSYNTWSSTGGNSW